MLCGNEFSLQAWAALPIFSESGPFVRTQLTQLPVFAGSPTREQLTMLEQMTFTELLLRARFEPAIGVCRLLQTSFSNVICAHAWRSAVVYAPRQISARHVHRKDVNRKIAQPYYLELDLGSVALQVFVFA